MLPTHHLVTTWQGYEIYQRQPGFEFTPMALRKIASFLVRGPGNTIAVFAFAYSMLAPLEGQEIEEEDLLRRAVQQIQRRIDGQQIGHRGEYTYAYVAGAYKEVSNPPWWIATFG